MLPLGNSNAIQFWNSRVLLWNTSVPNSFTPGPPFQTTASWGMQRIELFCQPRTKENSTVAKFENIFTSLLTIIFCHNFCWFSLSEDICKYFHISDNYFPVKSFLVSPGRVAELSQLIRCGCPQGQPYQCWQIFKILVIRKEEEGVRDYFR